MSIFTIFLYITVFLVFLVIVAFVYMLMTKQERQEQFRTKHVTIDDVDNLVNELNYGGVGEPLVAMSNYNTKQVEQDPWLEQMPKFTIPSEERGLVLGVSGTGKTSYLISQLIDWIQSGKSFVVTDVKPEIWAILKCNGVFERYGYEDLVINPTDPNALAYNPFDDISDFGDIDELLYIIVPRSASDSAVFADNARRLIKAIMYHLKQKKGSVSLPDVREYRYKVGDMKMLLENLKNSENDVAKRLAIDILDAAENENFFASILGSFTNELDFLENEVISRNLSKSDISLREKLQEPKKAVFLQFAEADKGKTYKIFGMMLSHVLRMLQLNHRNREDVFIAIDEIMNSAPINDLPNRLNVMRSAKMPLFMYLQTMKGLDALYGVNESNMMISACNFKACYRVNDLETAEMFSRMCGETEVTTTTRKLVPEKTPTGNIIMRMNEETSLTTDSLANPEELLRMEANHALLMYKGQVGKIGMPVYYNWYPMPMRNNFGTVSEYLALKNEVVDYE